MLFDVLVVIVDGTIHISYVVNNNAKLDCDVSDASATFLGELADVPGVTLKRSGSAFDACLLFITKNADLTKLRALAAPVTRSRAFIWVVYAKGRKDPREADVRAAGLAAGLVDVKVASFSPTHTALKFTARREKR